MTRPATVVAALIVLAHPAAAQDTTATVLLRAREFYEVLNVERALPYLRQVLSPQWPFNVSSAQRAEAYKYLASSLVLAGKADSAVLYFRAALARDPFTDLDPLEFTPAQIAAINTARRQTFALGARPVVETRVDPRTERITFTLVTTHAAEVDARIRPATDPPDIPVFAGDVEGVLTASWNGLLPGGGLAPPGRYQLLVTAHSRIQNRRDSVRLFFEIEHETELLEDTIPSIPPELLLPEREPASRAVQELWKGLGLAGWTLLLAQGATSGDLGGGLGTGTGIVAVAGAVAGLAATIVRARHGEIPENVEANRRRLAERDLNNDEIRRRNAAKLARAILVVSPAPGAVP